MIYRPPFASQHRRGASFLEVQVAMVMLAVGMTGLYSMVVVQTRQASRLRDRLPASDVAAINRASTSWERKLGVYANIEDTVVAADPVVSNVAYEVLLDDQDGEPTFTYFQNPDDVYGWISWSYQPSYTEMSHYHPSTGEIGSWCQFQADGLPPGEYEVLVSYPGLPSLGDAIPHEIYDGTDLVSTVNVNQQVATSGHRQNGRMFDSLGVFTISSGEVRVRLTDGPGGRNFLLGDAVWIRSRRVVNVISLSQDPDGGATAVLETQS